MYDYPPLIGPGRPGTGNELEPCRSHWPPTTDHSFLSEMADQHRIAALSAIGNRQFLTVGGECKIKHGFRSEPGDLLRLPTRQWLPPDSLNCITVKEGARVRRPDSAAREQHCRPGHVKCHYRRAAVKRN